MSAQDEQQQQQLDLWRIGFEEGKQWMNNIRIRLDEQWTKDIQWKWFKSKTPTTAKIRPFAKLSFRYYFFSSEFTLKTTSTLSSSSFSSLSFILSYAWAETHFRYVGMSKRKRKD